MLEPVAIATVVIAVAAYSVRAEFSRYAIFTIGVFRRVKRSSVREPGHECIEEFCDREIERGERRRWYKEAVLFGAPLWRFGGGIHRYCQDHSSIEIRDDLRPVEDFQRPTAEHTPTTQNAALSDASENITASFADALSLLPVMILVVCAALVLSAIRRVGR